MRDYQTKQNIGGAPDSITDTKFGAGEFNSIAVELEGAVTTSGQTLAPADGTGEDTAQLSKALSVYGSGGDFYVDTGAADAYVLDRAGSLSEVNDYFDGMKCVFVSANANTGASTVNVASLGVKSITRIGGTALSAGDISAGEHVVLRYDLTNDRFEIEIYSGVKALKFDGLDASVVGGGLVITDPGNTALEEPLNLLTPNQPNTSYSIIRIGKIATPKNNSYIAHFHNSDGSNDNSVNIGVDGAGFFRVFADGHAALTAGYLDITDDRTSSSIVPMSALAPDAADFVRIRTGVAQSTNNCAGFGFRYNGGAGSNDNAIHMGLFGSESDFILNGYGNVGIGTAPAGSGGSRLTIQAPGASNFETPLTALAPNTARTTRLMVGKEDDSGNLAEFGHFYEGDNNSDNYAYMVCRNATGRFQVFNDGHAELTSGYFIQIDARDIDGMSPTSVLFPNLTAGRIAYQRFGVEAANYNMALDGFYYAGDNSQDNERRIGLFGDPTAFRINGYGNVGIGTAPAGSGGDRLTVSGDTSISGALTVGGNPITSAGQMVTDASGYPYIDTTSFGVHTNVTSSTWESVGPTGSGATNIWTALDGVPLDADWIVIGIDVNCTSTADTANTVRSANVYVRRGGSSVGANSDSQVCANQDWTSAAGNGKGVTIVQVFVPVSSANIFDIYWFASFSSNSIVLRGVVGYGYNE